MRNDTTEYSAFAITTHRRRRRRRHCSHPNRALDIVVSRRKNSTANRASSLQTLLPWVTFVVRLARILWDALR